MQEIKERPKDNTIELVKWLAEHPKVCRRLCEDEYQVTPEECIEIIEMLEEKGFYEMIFILLANNKYDPVIKQAVKNVVVEKMSKEWKRIGTKQLCNDIKVKIREEIRIQESGEHKNL